MEANKAPKVDLSVEEVQEKKQAKRKKKRVKKRRKKILKMIQDHKLFEIWS